MPDVSTTKVALITGVLCCGGSRCDCCGGSGLRLQVRLVAKGGKFGMANAQQIVLQQRDAYHTPVAPVYMYTGATGV